jgi:hypothetical protein
MHQKADNQTNRWISENGMDIKSFNKTHPKLLKAQLTAKTLLKNHYQLLTSSQASTLKHFLKLMAYANTRSKLKPEAYIPIFNISTQLNRKLFTLAKLLK